MEVSILVIAGSRINSIRRLIDHEWFIPKVLSRKMSLLVCSNLGQLSTRCTMKVSSPSIFDLSSPNLTKPNLTHPRLT